MDADQKSEAKTESSPRWIFAVLAGIKYRRDLFLAPNFIASSFGILLKMVVSIGEVPVDRCARRVRRRVIAIFDNCGGHATEDRFNYVQKLGSRGQRRKFDNRNPWMLGAFVLL